MGSALARLRLRQLAHRRARSALWAAVLPVGTAATAGAASLLAIVLAVLAILAAAAEEESVRRLRDDDVGWAEMDDFLPAGAPLEQVVGKIRCARIVTSDLVGYGGKSSPVYDAYVRLGQLASDVQLRALVADAEPAVRVYAFHSLSDRQPGVLTYVELLAHLADNAPVRTLHGCISDESTVFDAMLAHVEHRLSPAQLTEVRELRELARSPAPATLPAGFLGRGR